MYVIFMFLFVENYEDICRELEQQTPVWNEPLISVDQLWIKRSEIIFSKDNTVVIASIFL